MKGNPRSRFIVPDKKELWRPADESWQVAPFNVLKHGNEHPPQTFTYTSKSTLDLVAGTPVHFPVDFVIESVMATVSTAASSAELIWDVLVAGASIFATATERPRIKIGDLSGRVTVPSRQGLPAGSKLQAQGIQIGGATGPVVLTFQLTQVP